MSRARAARPRMLAAAIGIALAAGCMRRPVALEEPTLTGVVHVAIQSEAVDDALCEEKD